MADSGDTRNWIERLGDKVPGYSGYVDRERRRDIDKLHRERLADRLRGFKTHISELIRDLSSTGRLFEVGPAERLLSKLDRIENRIRFASYGYSGFFDVVKIEQSQLESIYQFDLALVEHVDKIEALAVGLKGRAAAADGLKAGAAEVEQAIDGLNRLFDDRHSAIDRFGDQPTGRPLFSQ